MKGDSSSRTAARIEQIQNSDVDDTTKKLDIQKVYEDEGVSFEDISDDTGLSGGSGKRGFSGIHGAYDKDGNVHFTRYENGNAMNNIFSGQLDGTFDRAKLIHSNFLNWAGNDLSTSGSALGFSSMMYNHRIDTQRQALAMSSAERQAIYESRMRRIDLGRSENSWDVGNTSTWTGSMKYAMTGANGVLSDSFVNATHSVLKYSGYVVGGFAYVAAYRFTSLVFNKAVAMNAVVGSFANVATTKILDPSAGFIDLLQSGFTGYIGGALAGKLGGWRGAVVGGGSAEGINQLMNDEFDPFRLGAAATFSLLGYYGSSLISQRIGVDLSEYVPSSTYANFAQKGLINTVDDVLNGFQNTLVGSISNLSMEGVDLIQNGTVQRIQSQYEQQERFLKARQQLNTSYSGESFFDRAYKTRVGLRGQK